MVVPVAALLAVTRQVALLQGGQHLVAQALQARGGLGAVLGPGCHRAMVTTLDGGPAYAGPRGPGGGHGLVGPDAHGAPPGGGLAPERPGPHRDQAP
jgi:hypothetical protein